MKRILLILIFSASVTIAIGQTTKKSTYLIVRIDYGYDKSSEKGFYKIYAEPGNPFAKEIYNLIDYKTEKKAVNSGGVFANERTDTSQALYNYFKNATEALSFLSENNWELVSIYNQITSDYKTERAAGVLYPYTTVSSYPVYYFRKLIQ